MQAPLYFILFCVNAVLGMMAAINSRSVNSLKPVIQRQLTVPVKAMASFPTLNDKVSIRKGLYNRLQQKDLERFKTQLAQLTEKHQIEAVDADDLVREFQAKQAVAKVKYDAEIGDIVASSQYVKPKRIYLHESDKVDMTRAFFERNQGRELESMQSVVESMSKVVPEHQDILEKHLSDFKAQQLGDRMAFEESLQSLYPSSVSAPAAKEGRLLDFFAKMTKLLR